MSRIAPVDPAAATGKVKSLLDKVHGWFGVTPQLFRVTGQAPAALDAMVGLFAAVSGGALKAGLREQIALAVSELNGCDYCLSAHTAIGKGAGVSDADLAAARDAQASDPRAAAVLRLAVELLQTRGHLSDAQFAAARAAGLSDGEVLEVVTNVALTTLTNFINNAAGTEVDFPRVRARAA